MTIRPMTNVPMVMRVMIALMYVHINPAIKYKILYNPAHENH